MKIVTVVGARPQFVKAAAVSREIMKNPNMSEVLIHTGQHYDQNMSDIFFGELGIPTPGFHLDINQNGHGAMTGRMLEAIERVLIDTSPNVVIVYGDTNSTLAGALAATKLHIPIVHIEAGLRSFNRAMPEEINRVVSDHVSDLLLCPTLAAKSHLANEGITRRVHHVGDVMYDATLYAREKASDHSTILAELNLENRPYSVSTIHRAENTGTKSQLQKVVDFLSAEVEDNVCILPLHPRTKQALERWAVALPEDVKAIAPVGYIDMAQLLSQAEIVFTDSGGLQKEAYFHGKRCITLRNETEWTETIDAGWNRLWTQPSWSTPTRTIDEYGDGHAAARIVELLEECYL